MINLKQVDREDNPKATVSEKRQTPIDPVDLAKTLGIQTNDLVIQTDTINACHNKSEKYDAQLHVTYMTME